jgi:hypothetical protein
MRPVDDNLIGGQEPRSSGKLRPSIAHRHPVAQESTLARQRGSEVDRPEDQHPRPRRMAAHEHFHAGALPLTIRPTGDHAGTPDGEESAGVVGYGGVGSC